MKTIWKIELTCFALRIASSKINFISKKTTIKERDKFFFRILKKKGKRHLYPVSVKV